MKNHRAILMTILLISIAASGIACSGGDDLLTPYNDELADTLQSDDDSQGSESGTQDETMVDETETDGAEVAEDETGTDETETNGSADEPNNDAGTGERDEDSEAWGGLVDGQGDDADDEDTDGYDDVDSDDVDSDADGDGFTISGGDCDDANPSIFPGAPDKPDHPDYTDSDCDGVDGDSDGAYWVAPDGSDLNAGTMDRPFGTIQKAIDEANTNAGVKDVYITGGGYNEDVLLHDGVNLYGGFGPVGEEGLRPRDIELHESVINGQNIALLVNRTNGGEETIIEGFTINGTRDNPALVVKNTSPQIRHNKIYAPDGESSSVAAYVTAMGNGKESNPLFYGNLIQSANANIYNSDSVSFGVYAVALSNASVHPVLKSNKVKSGEAHLASVGIDVLASTNSSASLAAYGNEVEGGGYSREYNLAISLGLDVYTDRPMKFVGAEIRQNRLLGGARSSTCAGVYVATSTEPIFVDNNFITGSQECTLDSIGVYASESTVVIKNNTINAGVSTRRNMFAIKLGESVVVHIKNNILFTDGRGHSFGIYEETSTSTPEIVLNNFFAYPSLVTAYHDFVQGDFDDIENMCEDLTDIFGCDGNIEGEMLLRDVSNGDYHLTASSPAIDAGFNDGLLHNDIDDEARPKGIAPDIGADEF